MTTIIVTHEDNEIDEFGFDTQDQIISIGRRSTNDVCIPNLSVSGVHARITIDGDSALVEDNNSTNGTYINGRLISRQLLNENDEIVIGKTRVQVQLSGTNAQPQIEPPTLNAVQPESSMNAAPAPNPSAAALLNENSNGGLNNDHAYESQLDSDKFDAEQSEPSHSELEFSEDDFDDGDDSYVGEPSQALSRQQDDDRPMTLSEKAKLALGRDNTSRESSTGSPSQRNGLKAVATAGIAATSASAAASRAFANDSDTAVAEAPAVNIVPANPPAETHPLDGLDNQMAEEIDHPMPADQVLTENGGATIARPAGAVIEIQNGAKSGQVLPIDKPVTTLGRPGIQIAAIMRKPDGYFLMHIESDDSVEMPTLNRDTIGDDPVMLHSGDRLNVAGIDVEFMLS